MQRQRGFAFTEALVALLVLSIGLIGVAALELKALESVREGHQRALAGVAALDAQERLWAAYRVAPSCAALELDRLERRWRQHWFTQSGAALDGQAQGAIEQASCAFEITITHAQAERVRYRLELPRKSPAP
ncbi:prepilin-type N-terminal cleavage/methylation domain-containing protein [Halomonas sp. HNIBRBA4712]|uniref:prepilin-type N-terminal cleavage/methylation domain-containing protein n=1 Tax=Halomonas sp. HNIBRBA4712 TaxID=3373087 RepID=UPI003744B89D